MQSFHFTLTTSSDCIIFEARDLEISSDNRHSRRFRYVTFCPLVTNLTLEALAVFQLIGRLFRQRRDAICALLHFSIENLMLILVAERRGTADRFIS